MRPAPLGNPLFTVHAIPREGTLRLYRIVRAEDAAAGRLERAFVQPSLGQAAAWGEPSDLAACVTRIILVEELWDS